MSRRRRQVYAHAFVGADGSKIDVKKLDLDEDDLLAAVPLVDGPGRECAISEATGNEGATKDLWYHRGAVIMWPKERELELATNMDVDYGIHVLKRALQDQAKLTGKRRRQLMRLANHIVETLPSYRHEDLSAELIQLADIPLLKKFLFRGAYAYAMEIDPNLLIQAAERFGWDAFALDVQSRLAAANGLQWLDALLQTGQSISKAGQDVIRRWVASRWRKALTAAMQPASAPDLPSTARARRHYAYEIDRFHAEKSAKQDELIYLVRLTSCLHMEAVASQVMERLAAAPEDAFLTETYGPAIIRALESLQSQAHDPIIAQRFASAARERLQAAYPSPPEPPEDWRREGRLDCDCEFCVAVNAFLPQRDLGAMRIDKTLKRNLLHVESEVEKRHIEVDVDIQKAASKFSGVIRKNQRRYEHRRQLYSAAQSILRQLPA